MVARRDVSHFAAQSLSVLCDHARRNAGAFGDAICELRMTGPDLRIAHFTVGGADQIEVTPVLSGAISGQTTISLDAMDEPREIFAAANALAAPILQAFGQPEVPEIGPDGSVAYGWFELRDQVKQWCDEQGVPTRD
jgi:hypothetical protein